MAWFLIIGILNNASSGKAVLHLLLSAANTSTQQSDNKSSGAGVGIAIGADKDGAGISVFANAAGSKGKANGNSTSHTETTLQANDTLSITSGHDTTIKGAIVGGNTVVADRNNQGQTTIYGSIQANTL